MSNNLSRRNALQIGGLGMLGLTIPKLLRAESSAVSSAAAKAKSVIFLYQWGGPSHIDTFDPKPDAPAEIRGPFAPIATSAPGIQICEHLPQMAKVMDKVTLVRSVHHTMKNHNSAGYYALTGHAPPVDDIRLRDSLELFPAYGSVIDKFVPATPGIPSFAAFPYVISDGSATPGQHASFLGKGHDPLLVTDDPNDSAFKLPELSLPAGMSPERLERRREVQRLINAQKRQLEATLPAQGIDAYYEKALTMLDTPAVREAFDISREPLASRQKYGMTTYGQSCLLARRLVEAGVKFVNVYFDRSIGGRTVESGGWDTHGFDNTRQYPILLGRHLPLTEQTLPTLLTDLDERGLLDTTLVVWMGEFGRTPKINANISRDHWPQCYTVVLAGGGVRRGFAYGASDRNGAYPGRDPAPLDDIAATIFSLMGIDPETEIRDGLNRPLPVSRGRVLHGLIA